MKAGQYTEAGTGLTTAPAAHRRPAYVPVVQAEPMLRERGHWPVHLDGRGYREQTVDLAGEHPALLCEHCRKAVVDHTWRLLGRDATVIECSGRNRGRWDRNRRGLRFGDAIRYRGVDSDEWTYGWYAGPHPYGEQVAVVHLYGHGYHGRPTTVAAARCESYQPVNWDALSDDLGHTMRRVTTEAQ